MWKQQNLKINNAEEPDRNLILLEYENGFKSVSTSIETLWAINLRILTSGIIYDDFIERNPKVSELVEC